MKLTNKDKDFLEKLSTLLESRDLSIELVDCGLKYLVLRGNYGDKIQSAFKMSRQGVRWRFQRIFDEIYVSAYESIYFVESQFGNQLRQPALEIARQRVELRKKAQKESFLSASRR